MIKFSDIWKLEIKQVSFDERCETSVGFLKLSVPNDSHVMPEKQNTPLLLIIFHVTVFLLSTIFPLLSFSCVPLSRPPSKRCLLILECAVGPPAGMGELSDHLFHAAFPLSVWELQVFLFLPGPHSVGFSFLTLVSSVHECRLFFFCFTTKRINVSYC